MPWSTSSLISLSKGNADNLGSVRKEELLASASILGIHSPADVIVLDLPSFPDSMTSIWSPIAVAEVLSSAFTSPTTLREVSSQYPQSKSLSESPAFTIDVLLTFDGRGVSKHPNHISLYHGAQRWLSILIADRSGWRCPVELYTLSTTNLLRKYISVLDAPITVMLGFLWPAEKASKFDRGELPKRLLYVSDVGQWMRGQKAMIKGHESQMRWFRWGWITVGRYMVVNDLRSEKITYRSSLPPT